MGPGDTGRRFHGNLDPTMPEAKGEFEGAVSPFMSGSLESRSRDQ
jgi:hypothetical protein